MVISVKAYAKINLFLDIEGIRDNGYHNILSLMQSVTLHDKIDVEYDAESDKDIEIICDNDNIPCDRRNLAYKAAELILESGKVKITIEKSIPSEAGLAGGSADAAATLVGLNALLGNKYSKDELKALGAKIGADVPFCIEGGACIVEGIGEKTTPCRSMPDLPIVIARIGEGMSTPLAYGMLDERYHRFKDYAPNKEKLDMLLCNNDGMSVNDYCKGLFNIFESVVEPERPYVTQIKKIMIEKGACGAMMSGSGTSVFGIFENEFTARAAEVSLKEIGALAYLCSPQKSN